MRFFFRDFKHPDLGVADGVGEVVHVDALYVGFAVIEIEPLDVVLLSLVNVDRLGMNGGESGREIHFANDLRLSILSAGDIDNDEIVGRYRAQADRIRRIALLDPVPVISAPMQKPCFGQPLAKSGKSTPPKRSSGESGSSNAAHFKWFTRISRLSGWMCAVLGRASEKVVRDAAR